MTLQAPISDYNPQFLLCQSYYRYPGIKLGFTDLIHPQELHQYHPIFREIFWRVQKEKQNAKNKEEESYYYRFAQIWNQEYANVYGRIPPSVTKDRNTKKGPEYEWRTRDMSQIWPLFGINFSFHIPPEIPKTVKRTKWRVEKIVDLSALELLTRFCIDKQKKALLYIDYTDFRRLWNLQYWDTHGRLPKSKDFSSLSLPIQERIDSLLRRTYKPVDHISTEWLWTWNDLQWEDIITDSQEVLPDSSIQLSESHTLTKWITNKKIYCEREYIAFKLRCNTIKPEYQWMIPLIEEISKIWVIKKTEYSDRMKWEWRNSQVIETAIDIFTDILENK